MKLKTTFGEYELEIVKSRYLNNNKPYLGLREKGTQEPFSDITVNLEGLDHLKEYNFIDCGFINACFSYVGDCEKRLKKNLNIKGFHKYGGYYYFIL